MFGVLGRGSLLKSRPRIVTILFALEVLVRMELR